MLKLFYKNDGAVTVFLVMILVPVITVSSIFVDASRLRMAESVMASASDVTLETVLANYDAELNDYYGLMASSQNVDDFLSKTNAYLTSAMTANGVSESEANSMLSAIYSKYSGENVDLLQLALTEGEENVVSRTENGALNNAALMKKEITGFMKYRAPINLVGALVDKFTNIKKDVENSQKESNRIEKKNKFYEAQSELLKKAYEVYENKKEYVTYMQDTYGDITKYMGTMKDAINGYEKNYREYHETVFKNLYNSKDTKGFQDIGLSLSVDPACAVNTYSTETKATEANIKTLVTEYQRAITATKNAKDALDKVTFYEYKEGESYKLQYWVQTMKLIGNNSETNKLTAYAKKYNAMVKAKNALDNALSYTDVDPKNVAYPTTENPTGTLNDYITNLNTTWTSYYNQGQDASCTYRKYAPILEKCCSASINDINSSAIDGKIALTYKEIKGFKSNLENAEKKAKQIADGCKDLVDLAKEYKDALDTWEIAAEACESDEAKNDLKVIHGEISEDQGKNANSTADTKELLVKIDSGDVTAMQERYSKIETLLKDVRADFAEFKYFKEKIAKIGSYGQFKKAMSIQEREIVIPQTTLTTNSKNSFQFTKPDVLAINSMSNENNPDTINNATAFDAWLTTFFEEKEKEAGEDLDDSVDDAEEKKEAIDDQVDDKESDSSEDEGNINSDKELKDIPNRPSAGGSDGNPDGGDSSIGKANMNLADLIQDFTFSNNLERFYALDYMMSMFSYDTYEYEAKYKAHDDLGKSTSDLPDSVAKAKTYRSDVSSAWESKKEDIKFAYNKTLTNKLVDKEHNYTYGGEIEYILYGGSNKSNKANAYGRIYLIRYAMNSVPVFSKYWSDVAVTSVSSAISAATAGIVPEPLIRIAILLALVAFESAYDLTIIKEGMPVKFVKSKDDLYLSPSVIDTSSGKVDESKTGGTLSKIVDEVNGFFYSDYLMLFIFSRMSTGGETIIYSRIADVVQANMTLNLGNTEYQLSKAQVYFTLNATGEVPALMMKLPINQGDWSADWVNNKYKIPVKMVRGY